MTAGALPHQVVSELERLAASAIRPCLVSVPLPGDVLWRLERLGGETLRTRASVVWEHGVSGTVLLGFGGAITLHGGRASTLAEAAPRLRAVMAASRAIPLAEAVRPRFFGGARFSPSGAALDTAWDALGGWRFTVPSVLVSVAPGGALEGSLSIMSEPGREDFDRLADEALAAPFAASPGAHQAAERWPEHDPRWNEKLSLALSEIEAGRYRKVVLARSATVVSAAPFESGEVLMRLAARYRQCFVFKYREEDGAAWLGASPELLCSLQGGAVRAASLAGSRPRGATEADDRRLEADLLGSAKERSEHAFVSLAISEALGPLCDGVSAPEVPTVMKMANIQHLYTPLAGSLRPGLDLIDVVAALHPTPAVGGWPRAEALDAIERLEGMDRGWYAGPIGWLDMRGEGEFAVALRSALVDGAQARLYAGAGIVAGSVAEEEYAETEAKFRPLREALGAGSDG